MLPLAALFLLFQMSDCPMHAQHVKASEAAQKHAAEVDQHGDEAMGFSHELAHHSFKLRKSGGAIEVTANTAGDAKSIAAIRTHMKSVATSFEKGDFAKPVMTHGKMPDGADLMQDRKSSIRYQYEEVPSGGRLLISSDEKEVIDAVHRFLRFQIEEHRTGDPETIQP